MMRESIQYALDNHDEALQYAMQFARDMEPRLAEKFVGMYVNHYTVDAGEVVPAAAQKLLDLGFEAGLISKRVELEFIRSRASSQAVATVLALAIGAASFSRVRSAQRLISRDNTTMRFYLAAFTLILSAAAQDVRPKDVREIGKAGASRDSPLDRIPQEPQRRRACGSRQTTHRRARRSTR